MEVLSFFFQSPQSFLNEILKRKQYTLQNVELWIIDGKIQNTVDKDEFSLFYEEEYGIFEEDTVLALLEQLEDSLNFLTILTDRPAYFFPFVERMYEENGLVVSLFCKEKMEKQKVSHGRHRLILDFEKKGKCYDFFMTPQNDYIPIYKKTWQIAENLDITVPIGYNTVIVKNTKNQGQKPMRDRFEEAFYKKDEGQGQRTCRRIK